jgi:RIO kinase 1
MPRPEEVMFPSRKERFEDRRKEREQRKVRDEFFDHRTLLAISRLISQGEFAALDYPISTGKEGGVFRATTAEGFRAVKVYRIGNTVFRNLPPHVLELFRQEASQRNFTRLVSAWTRREHTLLGRLFEGGVRVPQPFVHFRNVLVMGFIGTGPLPAPRLQDAVVEDPAALLEDLTAQIRAMTAVKLVHGDLSPYNVLLHEGKAVLIDVAQAIPTDHPQAPELLTRDLRNFARYFEHLGVAVDYPALWEAVGGASVGPSEG